LANETIAGMFDQMADVMEIRGENAFRVNTYRKVARVLRDTVQDVDELHESGRLTELQGVGESSARKIAEFLETGTMSAYDRLMADFPAEALDLLRVPGLGPRTVGRLMYEKGVVSLEQLEKAVQTGALSGMKGVGEKTLRNIAEGIAFLRRSSGRTLLGFALPVAQGIVAALRRSCPGVEFTPAGSVRRGKETVGDLDILASPAPAAGRRKALSGRPVVEAFTSLDVVADVLASGDTKASLRTREGLQVDLRVVASESFGAALCYFTGSKAHNVKLRGLAMDRGLKVSEYGVFRDDERVAGRTEEDVYAALDLPWIPPELREDRGEVEAALAGELPELVASDDVRGDLHVHSDYSDGALSVLETGRAALAAGYEYVAITDHSSAWLTRIQGPAEERMARQRDEIDAANRELGGLVILKGAEVDILPDGSLEYDDGILSQLDLVIASVHTRFGMPEPEMTARVVKAAANPYVSAIGHLTGRLIGRRDAYELDVGAVVQACAEHGTALELNSHIDRLDADELVCRRAKETGVRILLGTDAHHPSHFAMMPLGIGIARRGWLEPRDVLNCMPADELCQYLRRGTR
jgi:DNA polymerase (family 10)